MEEILCTLRLTAAALLSTETMRIKGLSSSERRLHGVEDAATSAAR